VLLQVGFCAAVLEPTERARGREELLESVFSAFAQLWDEALGVSKLPWLDHLSTKVRQGKRLYEVR
jgi:hypothetical protein